LAWFVQANLFHPFGWLRSPSRRREVVRHAADLSPFLLELIVYTKHVFRCDASEFTLRLADLLRHERGGAADFLVALAEFDADRGWEALDYTSLFMYLHRELGLSKGAAYFRNTAARLVSEYRDDVVGPLRDGRLCMTAVVELSRVITPENHAEVIPQFFHCSKSEARALAAALAPTPEPPERDVVTLLSPVGVVHPGEPPVRMSGGSSEWTRGARSTLDADVTAAARLEMDPALGYDSAAALARSAFAIAPAAPIPGAPAPTPPGAAAGAPVPARAADPPRDEIEPLTAALARLHITVSRQFLDKLEAGRNALSHSKPGARFADILETALDLLLVRHDRRKGLVEKPRATPRPSRSDAIPAHVKRAVWKRDRGCCQWRLPNGEICGSRTRIQFDHIEPLALGGKSTVENVRLLCGPHNRLAARRVLGDACADLARRRRPRPHRVERARCGDGPGGG
jgi:hypothetical protein